MALSGSDRRDILYHPLAVEKDISALDRVARAAVKRAIESKLGTAPEIFGVPLRGTLKRLWKLRVGDWRVVYEIRAGKVIVLLIAHRRGCMRGRGGGYNE